ncbi:fumarate reductase subunit FrdD [Pseudomonadota bacterium]
MTIAKKSVVWALFAGGGTIAAFIFPVLIALFLLIALGSVPEGLQFANIHQFATNGLGKLCLFVVISLSLWHAAHRLRVVFHDFGVRKDKVVANAVYLVAFIGTILTAFYLYTI